MNGHSRPTSRVARHFDKNVELYIDTYAISYSQLCEKRLAHISSYVDAAQPVAALDVGCGGGLFADMLLARYSRSTVCCVDLSWNMLSRNDLHCRKRLVQADARALPFGAGSFDLVNVDAVMHHMIELGGYHCTMSSISQFLRQVRGFVKPSGVLVVREICHELFDGGALAGRLIYELSRLQMPAVCVRLLRRLGLQTAGLGVAFLTRRQWAKVFSETGWIIADSIEQRWQNCWRRPGLRSRDMFYICRPQQ